MTRISNPITASGGGGAGTPGGSDTQVQFNDSSAFGGDAGFTYNKTTNVATLAAGGINITTPTATTRGLYLKSTDGSDSFDLLRAENNAATSYDYIRDFSIYSEGIVHVIGGIPGDPSSGIASNAHLFISGHPTVGLYLYSGISLDLYPLGANTNATGISTRLYGSAANFISADTLNGYNVVIALETGDITTAITAYRASGYFEKTDGDNSSPAIYFYYVGDFTLGDTTHITTVTNYYGFYYTAPIVQTNSVITNEYGSYISMGHTGAGTVDIAYGMRITGTSTATSNYGLFIDIPSTTTGLLIRNTDDNNPTFLSEWVNFAGTSSIYVQNFLALSLAIAGQPGLGPFGLNNFIISGQNAIASTYYGIFVSLTSVGSSGDPMNLGGILFVVQKDETNSDPIEIIYGIYGLAASTNGNITTALQASNVTANFGATGGNTTCPAIYGYINTGFTIGNGVNVATVTNSYGFYYTSAIVSSPSGVLTNEYGVYIQNVNQGTTLNYAIFTNAGLVYFGDNLEMADAKNIILNTTTGTKIGTATNQKLGFFNTAPITQPSAYSVTNVTTDRTYNANSTTLDEIADCLGTLISDIQSLGLIG